MHAPWRDRRGRFLPFKAAVFASLFIPGALYAYWLATHQLGARPLTQAIHGTGLWTIRLLMISLAITPLSRVLEWPGLLLVRRNVGVAVACYGAAHLALYIVDENFRLLTVIAEIVLRFYLTIGFVALLGLLVLALTSTDRAVKRMGRNWKRLHRLAYPIGVLALLHYYIQSKLNVSEPVFVSGLFIWLMAWRLVPERWRRAPGLAVPVAIYAGLAIVSGLATAFLEFAWYGLATHVDAWRVLAANETIRFGLRPAHWEFLASLALLTVFLIRRLGRIVRPLRRVPA